MKGFTLIEALVVVTITGVVGILLANLFFQTIKGVNKTQLMGVITQNGQSALNTIDQTLRFASEVSCPANSNQTTVVAAKAADGKYYRFKIYPPNPSGTSKRNGFITQEILPPTDPTQAQNFCNEPPGVLTNPGSSEIVLTDRSSQNGVSVLLSSFFLRSISATAKDIVNVKLDVGPPVGAGAQFDTQSSTVTFQTSVMLR